MSTETEEETEETTTELPPEQEDRIVDKILTKVKEIVLTPPAKEEETEEEITEPKVKEPTSVREIENDMEAQVRAALHKIGAEEEHQKEHEKLKKETERTPVQVGKVTRFLWGGEE